MKIRVQPLGLLREVIKNREIKLEKEEKCTIRDVLIELHKICGDDIKKKIYDPATDKLSDSVKVLLNGRMITYLNGLETPVRGGDTVSFLPPMAGG